MNERFPPFFPAMRYLDIEGRQIGAKSHSVCYLLVQSPDRLYVSCIIGQACNR